MNDVASEWTDRWSVLKALIEQTATQVVTPPKQPGESVVNKGKEIANLLKHLGEFSEQLVTFFRYPANQSGFKAQVAVASTLEQAA